MGNQQLLLRLPMPVTRLSLQVWIGISDDNDPDITIVQAIIDAATGWKLVTGTLSTSTWTGPTYPNATGAAPGNFNQTCSPPCLSVSLLLPVLSRAVLPYPSYCLAATMFSLIQLSTTMSPISTPML